MEINNKIDEIYSNIFQERNFCAAKVKSALV